MTRMVCLLALLLSGCQGIPLLERVENASPSIMPLWQRYQACLEAGDFATLLQFVEEFDRAVELRGPEPPEWMKRWGLQAAPQPLRTAFDPEALGASCTLRVAAALREQGRVSEARLLYERLLVRYPRAQWAYYAGRAAEALAALPQADSPAVAFRPNHVASR